MTRANLLIAATILSCMANVALAQPRLIGGVMLIRCGPTDIILNQPLLEALLSERKLKERFEETFGENFSGITHRNAKLPAAHAAGTFQVHLTIGATITGEWDTTMRKKGLEVVIDHLQNRLNHMLYEQPYRRLRDRRAELQQRHVKMSAHAAELQNRLEQSQQRSAQTQARYEALQNELHAARLDVATEEYVQRHLAQTRDENVQLRDHLRSEIANKTGERDEASNDLLSLINRNAEATDNKALNATIKKLRERLKSAESGIAKWQELVGDVQSLLTVILEQLPMSELKLHRTKARVSSLEKASKELAKERQRVHADSERRQHLIVEIEHSNIDRQVVRQQLLDVERQLARMAPVRYELLRFL